MVYPAYVPVFVLHVSSKDLLSFNGEARMIIKPRYHYWENMGLGPHIFKWWCSMPLRTGKQIITITINPYSVGPPLFLPYWVNIKPVKALVMQWNWSSAATELTFSDRQAVCCFIPMGPTDFVIRLMQDWSYSCLHVYEKFTQFYQLTMQEMWQVLMTYQTEIFICPSGWWAIKLVRQTGKSLSPMGMDFNCLQAILVWRIDLNVNLWNQYHFWHYKSLIFLALDLTTSK